MKLSQIYLLIVILSSFGLFWAEPATAGADSQAEGIRNYELDFEGNKNLNRNKLIEAAQSELEEFAQEGYQRTDIDDAAFQMRLAYRQQGYAFAEVDYRYEVKNDDIIVTFEISEGPQVRLSGVVFEGVTAFDKEVLLSFFGLPAAKKKIFVESEIEGAISEIRNFYLARGYQNIQIAEPEINFSGNRRLATIKINLKEGPRYVIREVNFKGDIYPETRRDLESISERLEGRIYFRRRELELQSQVLETYGNAGYPDADIEVIRSGDPGEIILQVQIESGPKVWIEKIEIIGNEQTRDSFIRSRLDLQAGELYQARGKRNSFERLFRTGLFTRVDITLEPGSDVNHRILLVKVEESKSQEISLEVGWGSYELLRGQIGYREKNLMGSGRIFRAELGSSFKHRELQIGITDPWFLRSDVTADLPFFYRQREEPSFTITEFESSLRFSKPLSPNLITSLGYDFRVVEISDLGLDESIEDFDNNYNLSSIRLLFTYDTRDNIFFPTRGQRFFISGEVADLFLGSEINFTRFTTGLRRYFQLAPKLVLGLRYSTGLLYPTRDQETVPLGERFYNGGENTVRSFRQDQLGPEDREGEAIGGLAYNILSTELRYLISGPFAGTLFFDYGNISPNESHNAPEETLFGKDRSELASATFDDYFRNFRPAVGFGLQYLLPVGPVRLDFAFNPDASEGERDYTIHFSVGQSF